MVFVIRTVVRCGVAVTEDVLPSSSDQGHEGKRSGNIGFAEHNERTRLLAP